MTVLESSISVLKRAEELVIGRTIKCSSILLQEVLDTLLHGPWFVISGFQAILLLMVRCVASTLVVGLLLVIVSVATHGGVDSWQGLLLAAAAFGVGAVLLGLPSRPDAVAVDPAHVSELASLIMKLAPGIDAMKLVRQGIEGIQDVSVRRTSAARWILGLIWALLVWLTTRWMLEAEIPWEARSAAATYALIGMVVFVCMGAVVASYQNAQNRLRQTLLFGFLEAESRSAENE